MWENTHGAEYVIFYEIFYFMFLPLDVISLNALTGIMIQTCLVTRRDLNKEFPCTCL